MENEFKQGDGGKCFRNIGILNLLKIRVIYFKQKE
jgi:hypothetical protein